MSQRVFDDIKSGLEEAVAIAKGEAAPARMHVPASIDVRAIRKSRGLTQAEFARRYGFSLGAVRDWEQGRVTVDGSSRAFLLVIQHEPEAVDRALEPERRVA